MAINKVVYDDEILIDLTSDTVTAETLAKDVTAHDKSGAIITGTMESGGGKLAQISNKTVTEIIEDDLPGVTSIAPYLFYKCLNLSSVKIPNSVTNLGNDSFYGCDNLTSIEIPGSVTTIGARLCSYCSKLNTVTLHNGITVISDSMFYKCEKLPNITIPDSVTVIGSAAFSNCKILTRITIPASVTDIGSTALTCGSSSYNYTKVRITMLRTTPPTIASSTFYTSHLDKIIVPKGSGDVYKSATNWSAFADYIEEAAA